MLASDICSELARSALYEFIESELNSKDFEVNVESAAQSGTTNFIGIVSRINFNGRDDTRGNRSMILKTAPQNTARREQFHSRLSFVREIFMYNEV